METGIPLLLAVGIIICCYHNGLCQEKVNVTLLDSVLDRKMQYVVKETRFKKYPNVDIQSPNTTMIISTITGNPTNRYELKFYKQMFIKFIFI